MRKNYLAILEVFEIEDGKKSWSIHTVEFQEKDWSSALIKLIDKLKEEYNEVMFVDNYRLYEFSRTSGVNSSEPLYQAIEKELLTQDVEEDEQ